MTQVHYARGHRWPHVPRSPARPSARDQIRIVGSSTVYPFTTAVAEQFGKAGGGKTPVVESTGTGGGMKLFCAGVGDDNPTPPTPRAA